MTFKEFKDYPNELSNVNNLDERIAPGQLVVGTRQSDKMCYITYFEMKGKKIKLNSHDSWVNWSENWNVPLLVDNKFETGYRIAGTNGRWSSNARNADNLVIEHPCGYGFELPLGRFIELISDCTIKEGVIEKELLFTRDRTLISREEYEELIEQKNKEEAAKAEKESKLKSKKVPAREHKVGQMYVDAKNGNSLVYLGTIDIDIPRYEYRARESSSFYGGNEKVKVGSDKVTKHVYYELGRFSDNKGPHRIETFGYDDDKKPEKLPIFVDIYSRWEGRYHNERRVYGNYVSHYYMKAVKNKKQLSQSNEEVNYFDYYSDEDWVKIESAIKNERDKERSWNNEPWYKGEWGEVTMNFRDEYLAQKK